MKGSRRRLSDQLPPVLLAGGWVDIGHGVAIRLSGRSLLHRCNGKVTRRGLGWLVNELPLLNLILHQSGEKSIDAECQPA